MIATGTYTLPAGADRDLERLALHSLIEAMRLKLGNPRIYRRYIVIDHTGYQTVIRAVLEPRT